MNHFQNFCYTKEDGDMDMRYQYNALEMGIDDAHDRMIEGLLAQSPIHMREKFIKAVPKYEKFHKLTGGFTSSEAIEKLSAGIDG